MGCQLAGSPAHVVYRSGRKASQLRTATGIFSGFMSSTAQASTQSSFAEQTIHRVIAHLPSADTQVVLLQAHIEGPLNLAADRRPARALDHNALDDAGLLILSLQSEAFDDANCASLELLGTSTMK